MLKAIALSPAIIWLLATGQLTEFKGLGVEFKLREAAAKTFSLELEGSGGLVQRSPPLPARRDPLGKNWPGKADSNCFRHQCRRARV